MSWLKSPLKIESARPCLRHLHAARIRISFYKLLNKRTTQKFSWPSLLLLVIRKQRKGDPNDLDRRSLMQRHCWLYVANSYYHFSTYSYPTKSKHEGNTHIRSYHGCCLLLYAHRAFRTATRVLRAHLCLQGDHLPKWLQPRQGWGLTQSSAGLWALFLHLCERWEDRVSFINGTIIK